jgi:hypothetical protein
LDCERKETAAKMTGFKVSPSETEMCPNTKFLSESYHPLLHLLRILLVEALRRHKAQNGGSFDSFLNLLCQVDFLWSHLEGDAIEKYEFLRNRLSLVYLWKCEDLSVDNFTRCIMNPPVYMSDVFRQKRMRILKSIRPGALFVDSADN